MSVTGTNSPGTNFADLHRLHLALHEVQEQLTRGPRQVKAREQLVVQAETELTAKKEQFKQLRVTSDRKSLDLKTNEAKIADLRGKLNACSSNREFDIIKGQIEADTVANSVVVNRRQVIAGVSGGVMVETSKVLVNRTSDAAPVKLPRVLPDAREKDAEITWWWDAASSL